MLNFEHYLPTRIFFGKGEVSRLGGEAAKYGKRVLLVYGGGSIKKTGIYDQVMQQLEGFTVFELPGVQPNPRVSLCRKGAQLCKKEGIELILGVGGGSVIDSCKCIAVGAKYDGDVWDFYCKKAVPEEALPVGCVLTLAATSSENNHISVISNEQTRQKLALANTITNPMFAVLDPTYTYTVPKEHTAYSIADIMVHVMDTYFSKTPDTPLQDRFAESILSTVIENAPIVLEKSDDYAARANLMWCDAWAMSHLCHRGRVGDSTTHGLEHQLSAYYDIIHGLGIAIMWPNWARYVYRSNLPKFVRFAKAVWNIDTDGKTEEEAALLGIQKTDDFFRSLGIPKTLTEIGIDDRHFYQMAEEAVEMRGRMGWDGQIGTEEAVEIFRMAL
jgi:alcohol dehydrogenase YqhD (iron-dependent ADH family)